MDKKDSKSSENWYAADAEEVISKLETDSSSGISSDEAKKRLDEHGPNKLPEKKKQSEIVRFLKHFHDVLIYILLVAAVITAVLGHYTDTIVIIAVAVINASIGYFQENKAEKALENITKMLSLHSKVIRNGEKEEIDATDVVIGDLVTIKPGDKIPADLRLIEANNLKVEESPLTGESVPSEKKTDTLPEDTSLGDQANMAFMGTTVSAGTGKGIVVAVGSETELGKINEMMSGVEELTTPLLRQTAKFGKSISLIIVILAAIIYVFGYFFRDYDKNELLMSVIGLAVAAIPEGLPAILSIILALGVQRMAKRNAIIRTLPSVETLGSVSVICSDKTGTLTKNEMTVKSVALRHKSYSVSGTGYSFEEGEIKDDSEKVDLSSENALKELIDCFYICNDSSLRKNDEGQYVVKGEPTEGALITLYKKSGLEEDKPERKSTIPFDSEYKYMATLIEGEEGNLIYIKGAPDRLLEMASKERDGDKEKELDKDFWEDKISELASEGLRMLGGAVKKVDKNVTEIDHEDLESDVLFLGLAGIIDPPRDEAIKAVKECAEAGITVKMITGDHVETAKAIGEQIGIGNGKDALEGKEIEGMDDDALIKAASEYDVFARTSPEHKLRLVKALQEEGTICAMTGDGVNDAPALKKADIGIAMGIKGAEVTKEASEMVLADDNFSTIAAAVKEGRRIYDNLKKTILFILPTNGAESFLIIASILFGTLMPLTPVQILWVNMVTSVTVSLAIAFESIEEDAMKRPPRSPDLPLLSGYFIWRILFVSVLIGGGTLFISTQLLDDEASEELVRTVTMQNIVICQLFYLLNCKSVREFAFNRKFFENKAIFIVSVLLIVLQLAITYLPFMNNIFGTEPLEAKHWLYPAIMGIIIFIIVEIEKAVMRKIDASKDRTPVY